MGGDVDVEAGGAQGAQVGERGLGAGEEDEVDVAGNRRSGADAQEIDVGLGREGVEVVEIGDVGQDRDGDADPAAARRGGGLAGERLGVFGGESVGRLRRRGRGRGRASRCGPR